MKLYPHKSNPDNPTSLALLLHGYGADGQDLLGLADSWRDVLPDTAFYSCDAPVMCEMGAGFQWFSLSDWSPDAMAAGARDAANAVREAAQIILDRHNLSKDKLALVGFSQGTMVGLYTALRCDPCPAGVLGYSGALLGVETLAPAAVQMPICLVHGDSDTVVPVSASIQAVAHLEKMGYPVTLDVIPGLPHGIDHQGLLIGARFLVRILSPKTSS
ncbi:MAG: prolyl oligopeptidase family serine peptidase [Pseudomonadota bacterium]